MIESAEHPQGEKVFRGDEQNEVAGPKPIVPWRRRRPEMTATMAMLTAEISSSMNEERNATRSTDSVSTRYSSEARWSSRASRAAASNIRTVASPWSTSRKRPLIKASFPHSLRLRSCASSPMTIMQSGRNTAVRTSTRPEIQSSGNTTARIVKGRSDAMARWGRYRGSIPPGLPPRPPRCAQFPPRAFRPAPRAPCGAGVRRRPARSPCFTPEAHLKPAVFAPHVTAARSRDHSERGNEEGQEACQRRASEYDPVSDLREKPRLEDEQDAARLAEQRP